MWFGTADGLNRYDGYTFTQFRSRPHDTTTLSNNTIRSLYEDRSGVLWIGTDRGLNRFDQQTGKFTRFMPHHPSQRNLLPLGIASMLEDHAGRFWVGNQYGIFAFDREIGRFDTLQDWRYNYFPANNVVALHQDPSYRIWIGTWQGVRILEDTLGGFVESPLPHSLRLLDDAVISGRLTYD
jgi:ligand-binding sensor domain-containing protein